MQRSAVRWMALILAIALAGCGPFLRPAPPREGPPPQAPVHTVGAPVFFGDGQAQHLIPEERQVPGGDAAVQATGVVQALLAGPADPNLHRTIPAAVRLLEPVTVAGDVARVNLSADVLAVRGAAAVSQLLGSLALSLTEIAGIDRVEVLVEGRSGAALDEGVILAEPLGRPFRGDIPFMPDANRTRYLQAKADSGEESWRLDPARVLQFEGRGFGFPLDRLKAAELTVEGARAEARIPYRGTIYLIGLIQNPEAKTNAIWTINAITSHQAQVGATTHAIYFADRQFVNVIPEARALDEGPGLATAVVDALLAGPADPYLARTFPPGTRRLKPVIVAGGTATVDLSAELLHLQGSAEAARAVDALVFSLTEVGGVHAVQILVEGKAGERLGNYRLDQPLERPPFSEQYYLDTERVAWLQARVDKGQESFRLDPLQALMWEGRALGMGPDLLKTAQLEQQADRALATVHWRTGKSWVIELGRNPGDRGIWFIKSVAVQ
jgi:spore germination protein GerM